MTDPAATAPVPPAPLAALLAQFGESRASASSFRGQWRVDVAPRDLVAALTFLCDEQHFDFLADVTAVDLLEYAGARDRFEVVYNLVATGTAQRLLVRTHVDEPDPRLPTATSLWPAADWLEREVFDMFGIRFEGHPDLRRILLPNEFSSWPLRKDYPLRGRGERHNFVPVRREGAPLGAGGGDAP